VEQRWQARTIQRGFAKILIDEEEEAKSNDEKDKRGVCEQSAEDDKEDKSSAQ
jgi:hypothetical protein